MYLRRHPTRLQHNLGSAGGSGGMAQLMPETPLSLKHTLPSTQHDSREPSLRKPFPPVVPCLYRSSRWNADLPAKMAGRARLPRVPRIPER